MEAVVDKSDRTKRSFSVPTEALLPEVNLRDTNTHGPLTQLLNAPDLL